MISSPSDSSLYKQLVASLAARKAWEFENNRPLCPCHPQGLADAWTEAKRLDSSVDRDREIELARQKIAADAAYQLVKLGVPKRAAESLRVLNLARLALVGTRSFLERPEGFLVLLGGPGTGKTVAAAFAMRHFLLRRALQPSATVACPRDVGVWVSAGELATMGDFGDGDRAWLERMGACELLVLDDVGTETLHANALSRLERIVDARYGNSRATIITSNANVEKLGVRLGERIMGRIREAGTVFECGNESMRRRA